MASPVDHSNAWAQAVLQIDRHTRNIKLSREVFDSLGPSGEQYFQLRASAILGGQVEFFQDSSNYDRIYLGVERDFVEQGFNINRSPDHRLASLISSPPPPQQPSSSEDSQQQHQQRPSRPSSGSDSNEPRSSSATTSQRSAAEPEHIKRPSNCYMLYRKAVQGAISARYQRENGGRKPSRAQVSKESSAMWKACSAEERKYWKDKAKTDSLEHKKKNPNYQYCSGKSTGRRAKKQQARARENTPAPPVTSLEPEGQPSAPATTLPPDTAVATHTDELQHQPFQQHGGHEVPPAVPVPFPAMSEPQYNLLGNIPLPNGYTPGIEPLQFPQPMNYNVIIDPALLPIEYPGDGTQDMGQYVIPEGHPLEYMNHPGDFNCDPSFDVNPDDQDTSDSEPYDSQGSNYPPPPDY
ncbi:hypothetical protein GGS20DRAFT_585378 [Poronia punctata]|nr:hypothetical protein GGS20DRAFT_585378 [Poronia punctata]